MRVIDQDTGRHCHLDVTEELQADLDAHYQSCCIHRQTEIRKRKNKGGILHFYRQCMTCGASVGPAIKRTPKLENSPAWKDDHEAQYNQSRRAEYDAIILKHVRKQKSNAEGFKREYDIYLDSATWHAKRSKVLDRAKGLCEGCLERRATQVHHLTYNHIFEEFLFELIAVCDECHVRLHLDKAAPSETDNDLRSEWEDHYPCDGCRFGTEKDDRRWCGILEQYAVDALGSGGDCGPKRATFEPLK
jgi:hypothetical protein